MTFDDIPRARGLHRRVSHDPLVGVGCLGLLFLMLVGLIVLALVMLATKG